jgi:oxygen-independent coproporphyrinogen III oxidase
VDAEYYIEMNRRIKNAFPGGNSIEITLEANPGTLNAHQLDCIRRAGFNRASLGVQSLNDNLLLRMGRIHNCKRGGGKL